MAEYANDFKKLAGRKFNRLTFLEYVDRTPGGKPRYRVRCECGTEFVAIAANVVYGRTRSCGCYRKEQLLARIHQLRGDK